MSRIPCWGPRHERPAAAPHHHRKRACSALAQRGRPHAGDRAGSGTNIAGLGMARQHRGDRSRRAVFLHSMVISDCRCCWQDAIQPCSLPMVTARGWRNPATVATTTATGRSSPTEDENSGDWFNRPCSLISEVSGQSDRDNVRRACSSATMSAVCHARAGSAAAFVNSAGTQPLATSPKGPSAPASCSTTVLLSRRPRKAQCRGICLPISAVRGCGYSFFAPVSRLDS